MHPATEIRVKEVVTMLLEGKKPTEIVEKLCKKYTVGRAIVYRYMKFAEPLVSAKMDKRIEKVEAKTVEVLEKAAEANVLSTIRKRELLSDIAEGKMVIKKTVLVDYETEETHGDGTVTRTKTKRGVVIPVVPDHYAVISSVQTDNTMTGDNAPIKVDTRTVIKVLIKKDAAE
jgi:hypothetical protein